MENSLYQAPAHLSDEAQDWWDKIVSEFDLGEDCGLLVLQSALEAFDRMKAAQALIAEHGILIPDRFGQQKTNPAVLVERDSRSAMLAAFKALHLDLEPVLEPGRPPGS